jgi:hypothetical protein
VQRQLVRPSNQTAFMLGHVVCSQATKWWQQTGQRGSGSAGAIQGGLVGHAGNQTGPLGRAGMGRLGWEAGRAPALGGSGQVIGADKGGDIK